jgi:hypothetical protein
MEITKKRWWLSSKKTGELARTVRGYFTVGVVALIASLLGVEVTDVNGLLDSLEGLAVAGAGLAGAVYGTYGAIMKIVNRFTVNNY